MLRRRSPGEAQAPAAQSQVASPTTAWPAPLGAVSAPASVPLSNDTVWLDRLRRSGRVGRVLGQGGQGTVMVLHLDGGDEQLALKWYFPRSASVQQRDALEMLVERGAPSDRFLWPLDMARSDASPTMFGYVMPLRPPHYAGLVDLVSGRVDVPFRVLATIGLELSNAFLVLHNEGLCYRDISFANVFFDPANGRVLVCDNDNVGIDGMSLSTVRGTPYFMAPEVVRGEAMPSRSTDLWSLAVLLFYVLFVHHPLEGRRALDHDCWDEAAMRDLFGDRPLFVFDPDDSANAPVPGLHDNALVFWAMYPRFLRDIFTQAFTRGIQDPDQGRVPESVLRAAMARMRDAIVYCQACGRQNIYDEGTAPLTCWSCGSTVALPPFLRIGRGLVALNHDTVLTAHHRDRTYNFSDVIGEVVRNPNNPSVWGLRNVSDHDWTVDDGSDALVTLEPGRATTLTAGRRITIGSIIAEVVVV